MLFLTRHRLSLGPRSLPKEPQPVLAYSQRIQKGRSASRLYIIYTTGILESRIRGSTFEILSRVWVPV